MTSTTPSIPWFFCGHEFKTVWSRFCLLKSSPTLLFMTFRHYSYEDNIWLIKAIPILEVITMNAKSLYPLYIWDLQYAITININYQVEICFEYGCWGISHAILLTGNGFCMANSLRNGWTIFYVNSREKENFSRFVGEGNRLCSNYCT